jgi:hypothetical protein
VERRGGFGGGDGGGAERGEKRESRKERGERRRESRRERRKRRKGGGEQHLKFHLLLRLPISMAQHRHHTPQLLVLLYCVSMLRRLFGRPLLLLGLPCGWDCSGIGSSIDGEEMVRGDLVRRSFLAISGVLVFGCVGVRVC